jgi:Subtilisin inhibitor-like
MGRICKETVSSTCVLLLMACVAALMTGCGPFGAASSDSRSASPTDLTVTYWPQGPGGRSGSRQWTLRCDPAGGTHPDARKACGRLSADVLRPLPPGTICTQIYGGPQTARVRGRYRGRRVDVRFGRANGCEIDRWNRLGFLLAVKN